VRNVALDCIRKTAEEHSLERARITKAANAHQQKTLVPATQSIDLASVRPVSTAELTYKSHILIGVRENAVMTVIADWPHLPKQSEVEDRINDTRNDYSAFVLCTPTSIMPAGGNGTHAGHSSRFRRGK
jgi:hypothetical protein